jgi:hypothetical protein
VGERRSANTILFEKSEGKNSLGDGRITLK